MKNYNEFISCSNSLDRIWKLRAVNEKRFFLARIAVELESLEKKFLRENKSDAFLAKAKEVSQRIKMLSDKGNLSASEIKDYCETYKIKLNYA